MIKLELIEKNYVYFRRQSVRFFEYKLFLHGGQVENSWIKYCENSDS